jgi:hypothetical protein
MCYVKAVQPGGIDMIASTSWCPANTAESVAAANTCTTQTIAADMATWKGYKMPNADFTWATGFVITDVNNNIYTFGKVTGLSVTALPTYGIVGNICGMKFDNLEKMQYFAFKYD